MKGGEGHSLPLRLESSIRYVSSSLKSALCGLALLAGLTASASAQNLLTNGSFETTTLSGWTTAGSVQVANWQGASNGTWAAVLNGGEQTPNGVLAQTFATIPGAQYRVSFDYGAFGWSSGQSVAVLVTGGTTSAPLLSKLVTIAPVNDPVSGWWAGGFTTFTYTFTANGTSATVAFQDQPTNGTKGQDGMLDNVSVTLAADTAAPVATASLVNLSKGGDDESTQLFRVVFAATDNVGVTSLTATLNGVTVTNGQTVQLQLIKSGAQSTKRDDGRLQIKATSFLLTVTATDRANNKGTATATAVFIKKGKDDDDKKSDDKKDDKDDDRKKS